MKESQWIEDAVNASNDYEKSNTELKKEYLIKNIQEFNNITAQIKERKGTFGTGYPFYVLDKGINGRLPIIQEQIRYNKELLNHARTTPAKRWTCAECLTNKGHTMPDLKRVCKPCPKIDKELKPRKVINRLPDIDMWMICEDGKIEEAQEQLSNLLAQHGIFTSDVNPLKTIGDMTEIVQNIKDGIMPEKFLPIDAHIMEYSEMKELISQVLGVLREAIKNLESPYLPIHPKSYRKVWQYDDEAYNFISDFLASFTEFDVPDELEQEIQSVRSRIAKEFNAYELYNIFLKSTSEANRRRFREPALKKRFWDRIGEWKNIEKADIGEREL